MKRKWPLILAILILVIGYAAYRSMRLDPLGGLYGLHPTSLTKQTKKQEFSENNEIIRTFEFTGTNIEASRKLLEDNLTGSKWRITDKDDTFEFFSDSKDFVGHHVDWFLVDKQFPTAKVVDIEPLSKTKGLWLSLLDRLHPTPSAPPATSNFTIVTSSSTSLPRPTAMLVEAIAQNNLDDAKKAVATGAKINALTNFGECPLETALEESDLTIARYLLEHGGKPNLSIDNQSLIGISAGRGRIDAMELLLKHGAHLSSKDAWPLILCCDQRSPVDDLPTVEEGFDFMNGTSWEMADKSAEFLLERGLPINGTQAKTKQTALHKAAACGHLRLVNLLLAHGANPTLKDADGKTPLDLTMDNRRNQWRAVAAALERAMPKTSNHHPSIQNPKSKI